jgi:hypothetical protein
MAAVITEHVESRSFTLGAQAVRELVFNIFEAPDEDSAKAAIVATVGASYEGLALDSVNADPVDGRTTWKGYARYTRLSNGSEYTFDTGGGTQHMTQSLATVASYAPAGLVAPDFKGAIGVSEDKVEGVDVPSPAYQFTETHYIVDALVTQAYKNTLFQLTGNFNNASFKGFAAGECLFMGAAGSVRAGDLTWAITYRFMCSPNATGLQIGGTASGYYDDFDGSITGIDKLGWDYLWVRYGDFEDSFAYALVKQPVAVYVERVSKPGDFSLMNIGV